MGFYVDFKRGPMEELFLAVIAFIRWCFPDDGRAYLEFDCSSSSLLSGVLFWRELVHVGKSFQSDDFGVRWKRARFSDWG